MYPLNLQNIIRKLLETGNNKITRQYVIKLTRNYHHFTSKSALSLFKNLSVITLAILTFGLIGCEDPGNVGGGFLEDNTNLETSVISVGSIEEHSTRTYSGQHQFMPIGRYDDAMFGEYTAIGILKPSINTNRIDSVITEEDTFQLRLVFSSEMYGDTTSVSEFDIFELSEPWRGNELRFGESIPFDDSRKIGEFTATGNETVIVDLDDEDWIERYNHYLMSEGDDRNSVYRDEFYGLAIVPAETNSKVLFAAMRTSEDEEEDDLDFVRFVVDSDDYDEDSDEADPRSFQLVADWGALNTRSQPEQENPEAYTLHNSLDELVEIDPEINEDRLGSRNLANVRMVFYKNRDEMEASLPAGHVRPEVNQLRIHVIESGNTGDYIFSRNPHFIANYDSSDNSFTFDITDYANSIIFNATISGNLYLTAAGINGIVYATSLFGEDATDESLRPKISITSVNSENK